MSDVHSFETVVAPSKHPSDDLVREWAAMTLGVDKGTSSEACSRRFIELLRDGDGSVEPPIADSFRLLNARSKEHFSANLKSIHPSTRGAVGRFLIQTVETFALEFPSLAPNERCERWERLSSAADFDPFANVRLLRLKPLLNVPQHCDCVDESDSRWLSQRILEILVRPVAVQYVEWNKLIHKLERTPKITEAMARKLMQSSPELKEAALPWLTTLANLSTHEKQQTKRVTRFVRSNVGTLVGRESRSIARHVFKGSGRQTQSTGTNWGWVLMVAGLGLSQAFRSCNQSDEYANRRPRSAGSPFQNQLERDSRREWETALSTENSQPSLAEMYFEKDIAKSAMYRQTYKERFDAIEPMIRKWEEAFQKNGEEGLARQERDLNAEIVRFRSAAADATATSDWREFNRQSLKAKQELHVFLARWRRERMKQEDAKAAATTADKQTEAAADFQSFLDSLPNPNESTTTEAKP